jgi:hypothetical protein
MAKGAKRKAAARKATRKAATTRRTAGRTRATARKTPSAGKRKTSARKKKAASAGKKKASVAKKRASVAKKTTRRATSVRSKTAAGAKKKAPIRKAAARVKTASARKRTVKAAAKTIDRIPVRVAPSLNRERRTIRDDDVVPTPPSSLDLDRTASAARSGRRELKERYDEHTETGPALTGGDVDADWESAYSVGDEAPGGDSPTPDQDIVDDIGRAVGIEYQDNEELKGEAKVSKRDRNRWELDPASSDDWDER